MTEYIYGSCTSSGVKGGIGIPGFDSFLVGWSTSTQVIGLDSVPPDDRPPVNTMLHWAFDTMVGICTVLIGLGALARDRLVAEDGLPAVAAGSSARSRVSGVAAIVALECGWIVTEVGRQPWIVYNVMRTSDAVTHAERHLGHVRADRRALRRARRDARSSRCGRCRGAGADEDGRRRRRAVRPGRRAARRSAAGAPRMSSADAVAVVLVVGVTMYAVFGGADFGAGLVEPARRRRRARHGGRAS